MTSSRFSRLLPAFLLLPALPHNAGGWAVVTVKELPDHAVAGQPLELAYAVRQHGMQLIPGLQGRVVARSGTLEVTGVAAPTFSAGRYAARLTLPRSGAWTITIHSGFMNNSTTLLPLRVVDPGTSSLPHIAEAERGRHLFVAKGCATCHTHAGSGVSGIAVGPDLTDRRFPADYLAKFLADPTIKQSQQSPTTSKMPDLELAPREIASLVAFINAERRVSGR
jgi:hypothetical protein